MVKRDDLWKKKEMVLRFKRKLCSSSGSPITVTILVSCTIEINLIVHGIGAKFVSNREQNIIYQKVANFT